MIELMQFLTPIIVIIMLTFAVEWCLERDRQMVSTITSSWSMEREVERFWTDIEGGTINRDDFDLYIKEICDHD